MKSIKQLLEIVTVFDPIKGVEKAMKTQKQDLAALQRNQLFHGLNSKDQVIGDTESGRLGYKDKNYAFDKYKKNPLPGLGNPDLFDTGDFYRGITVTVTGRKLSIYSTDSKNLQLSSKYPFIFGLGPKAQKVFIESFLAKAFFDYRKSKIKL